MVATSWPPFCFVGFGTDRLRREKVMKTAGRENPNRYATALVAFRVYREEAENNSAQWGRLGVDKKSGRRRSVFFLTPFIELLRSWQNSPHGIARAEAAFRTLKFTGELDLKVSSVLLNDILSVLRSPWVEIPSVKNVVHTSGDIQMFCQCVSQQSHIENGEATDRISSQSVNWTGVLCVNVGK